MVTNGMRLLFQKHSQTGNLPRAYLRYGKGKVPLVPIDDATSLPRDCKRRSIVEPSLRDNSPTTEETRDVPRLPTSSLILEFRGSGQLLTQKVNYLARLALFLVAGHGYHRDIHSALTAISDPQIPQRFFLAVPHAAERLCQIRRASL